MKNRIQIFEMLFEELQSTNSRIEKETFTEAFLKVYPDLKEDWTIILETLDNKHPIGWTFEPCVWHPMTINFTSIKEIILFIKNVPDLSEFSTRTCEGQVGPYGEFIAPIVNRTLKLGIGKSLLEKPKYSPMLAKKYEGQPFTTRVYITEKLDGNRCIAYYDHLSGEWQFKSRNGKDMKVDFDMGDLPKGYIYDGEVMSREQTERSINRANANYKDEQTLFAEASGIINSNSAKKDLVYNIFDIISYMTYEYRRMFLDAIKIKIKSNDLRIIPVLYIGTDTNKIDELLEKIVSSGGEGIMINIEDGHYEQKRSNTLLKYKKVQTIDMRVDDIEYGTSKYEDQTGTLLCSITTDDGKVIKCKVGTGLSDEQRLQWAINPDSIIGSIIEVGYFGLSQNAITKNTNNYSLRFPRLLKVRRDKNETSEY